MNIFVDGYFEDETAHSLTQREAFLRVYGIPVDTLMFPHGTSAEDMEIGIASANGTPAFEEKDVLTMANEIEQLKVFLDDVDALRASRFLNTESAFSLAGIADHPPHQLNTVSREVINDFILVFRRLYMETEFANLKNIHSLINKRARGTLLAKWINLRWDDYTGLLNDRARMGPLGGKETSFSKGELIRCMIYCHFAHQPDPSERSRLLFDRCLAEVGDTDMLEWMFYCEVQHLACIFINTAQPLTPYLNAAMAQSPAETRGIAKLGANREENDVEKLLCDWKRDLFESYATRLAEAIRERDGPAVKSLHECLRSARMTLRQCIRDMRFK